MKDESTNLTRGGVSASEPRGQRARPTRVVLTLGDPGGVGAELVAKLLDLPAVLRQAQILVVADSSELEIGASTAGTTLDFMSIGDAADLDGAFDQCGVVLLHRPIDGEGPIPRAKVSARNGKAALSHLTEALRLVSGGLADALVYAPLNKASLKAAGLRHDSEAHYFAELLGHTGSYCEVSRLDHLWTTRVTSHIALREVADRITFEAVIEAAMLAYDTLRSFGTERPRIAVCGLNPHAGDAGMLGSEEIGIIAPAIAHLRDTGLSVEGPFPADSLFPKAWNGAYDVVVSMYHDQGQIALKAIGFDHGVTIHGGLPVPIVTPAQGSAFDIVGKNLARVDALERAFLTAVALAERPGGTRAAN